MKVQRGGGGGRRRGLSGDRRRQVAHRAELGSRHLNLRERTPHAQPGIGLHCLHKPEKDTQATYTVDRRLACTLKTTHGGALAKPKADAI